MNKPDTAIKCITERQAEDTRRAYMNSGYLAGPIVYNTESGLYEYDVY